MRALSFYLLMIAMWPVLAEPVFPGAAWERAKPEEVGMDAGLVEAARDYALTGEGSGYITRHGKLVAAWGPMDATYDLKSSTKAIGASGLGLAMLDGMMALDDKAIAYQPDLGVDESAPEASAANRASGWLGEITLRHLATQTAGFEKPGGYGRVQFVPGTAWYYSDAGPNWLAECVTKVYKQDLEALYFERIFKPIGIGREDLHWRKHAYRLAALDGVVRREWGSGIHANADAMARIGYLYLRRGAWEGNRILPEDFIDLARQTDPTVVGLPVYGDDPHGDASAHYGLLWWNNADGALADVPQDAYWSWGLYDSLIVVIPSLDVVASRAGKSWRREEGASHYAVLAPFIGAIARAVEDTAVAPSYPDDPLRAGLAWQPKEAVLRLAEGSDNWPTTWGDDDRIYTAYGDGWGFVPKVPEKLSLGLCAVSGGPADPKGENLRAPTLERTGNDVRGAKASGILMVDGVLYLLARNTGNATVVWSEDHGATWSWADWRFEESFGAPSFLNFGKNYAGARDGYVYLYSQDRDSAYEVSDATVLARVPKARIRERGAYEFFVRVDADGQPVWSGDVAARGPVLGVPGRCYRTTVAYAPAIARYLLCQTHPDKDDARNGGLSIFSAPEPWGPWSVLVYEEEWDIDPGETMGLPTKWMGMDGADLWLVFSGDDTFAVRGLRLGEGW